MSRTRSMPTRSSVSACERCLRVLEPRPRRPPDPPVQTPAPPIGCPACRLPNDVPYCPASLAFQPRVDHIDASNKMKVAYNWEGDRLRSVVPAFDKPEHATGEKPIAFAYDATSSAVNAVGYGNAAAITSSDPDELYKRATPLLSNNPYVDPPRFRVSPARTLPSASRGTNISIPLSGTASTISA